MKKYVLVLAIVALLVPSLALASWWNPTTWFNKTRTIPVTVPEPSSVNQGASNNSSPDNTAVVSTTLDTSSWTTYTDKVYGIFSMQHPNNWTQTQEASAIYLSENESTQPVILISFGNGTENQIAKASENFFTEKVTLGSNIFTKITISENPLTPDAFNYYLLPLGSNGESSFHLVIQTINPSSAETMREILSNIKIDASRVTAAFAKEEALARIAKVKSMVANFRGLAESYYDANLGYNNMCSPKNGSPIDKAFKDLLAIVSSTDVFCNSSNDAYVFYVRNFSEEIICADSIGKLLVGPSSPKALSCE